MAGVYKVPYFLPGGGLGWLSSLFGINQVVKRGNIMALGKNITWNKRKEEVILSFL